MKGLENTGDKETSMGWGNEGWRDWSTQGNKETSRGVGDERWRDWRTQKKKKQAGMG